MITTGIRWAESNKRRERETFEVITRDKNKKAKVTDEKFFRNQSEYIVVVEMLHDIFHIAMQDITQTVNRVYLHIFVVA